jgi:hypothetical protein
MRLRFAVCLVPFVAALAFASCSNETEGQPCDTRAGNSGDDDCASGLVCTAVSSGEGDRCCPSDRTTAKTPECALSSTTGDAANPAPPLDASTDTSTPDSPAETASEAGTTDASDGASGDASDGSTTE